MAGEQEVNKKGDQVSFDLTDRTAESTAEDSVIAGDQKRDHQQRHQEMEKSGRDFNTFSDNNDDQSFQALMPRETAEQYQARLAQRKEQEAVKPKVDPFGIDFGDGIIETARGKSALRPGFRHGHIINEAETLLLAQASDSTHEPTQTVEQNIESVLYGKYHRGEPLTLSEFFQLPEGVSPVVDAYRLSLTKLEKEPGKSPTLEHSIFRLKNCPWADEIKIVYNGDVGRKDYDPNTKTIEIGGKIDDARKIETFVHEAYHATHRGYFKLYLDPNLNGRPASVDDFLNVRFGDEVRAFIEEIKINNELTSKFYGAKPVTMMVIEKGGIGNLPPFPFFDKDIINRPDLNALYAKDGLSGIWLFLRYGKPPQTKPNDELIKDGGQGFKSHDTYGQRYRKQYEWYQNSFDEQSSIAQQALIKFIHLHHKSADFQDWGY